MVPLVKLFILTLTAPFYLQASGFEPTTSPFTSTRGVSDYSSETSFQEQDDTFSIEPETISSTADYRGIDSKNLDLTSSNEPQSESLFTLNGTQTSPTVKNIKFPKETFAESKGRSDGNEVLRNFQCDIVAYQCSQKKFVARNSTNTFLQNSTDEYYNSREFLRHEKYPCKETILAKKLTVIVSTESKLTNFNQYFELNFLQSCPPDYPHKNVTELCERPWNNNQLHSNPQLFLPVMSTRNQSSTIASNVYCGLCNGFKTIDPMNVTILCGQDISDDDIHSMNLQKCKSVISIKIQQTLIRFPYILGKGILHENLLRTNGAQVEAASGASILENTTSFGSESTKIFRINNCVPLDQTDFWGNGMGVNNTRNSLEEDVYTKVDFFTNNNATDKDSNEFQCDEMPGFPFEVNVCYHSSSSFTDMKQVFVLAYGETDNDRQDGQLSTKIATCVSALRTHLSGFVARISRLEYHNLGSKSKPSLISVIITYRKRVFPADLFRSVEKLKDGMLQGCNLEYVSNLSRCLPGYADDETLLRTESFVSTFPDAVNLGIPPPAPCDVSRQFTSPTESNSSMTVLKCDGYILVSIEDFRRLNMSSKLGLQANYIKTVNGEFWICSEYLDQINKLVSKSETKDDSTDEGQGLATVICISVSLAALSATLLLKLLSSKPKKFPLKIMLNVMASLFLSQLLLLLMNIRHPVICTMVAILSHYFWLSTFSWMLVFSVHMYMTFCKIQYSAGPENVNTTRRTVICYGAGYGGPMLIVLPTVVIHFCSCTELVIGYGVGGCFIFQPLVNLVSFASPIGLSILVNLSLFVRTIYQIHKTSTSVRCTQTDTINCFRIFLKICSLSGFAWIFGYIAILTNNNVIWYIFTVLSSLQGVYIFIAFGLRDIQQACLKRLTQALEIIRLDSTMTTSQSSESIHTITKL